MTLAPATAWWTAEEIAASGLPDLPATPRGVNALATRDSWRAQPGLARRRSGKGGGWEYSWKLFPGRAQKKLLQAIAAPAAPVRRARGEVWEWFEALPAQVQDKARARLLTLQKVEGLEAAMGRDLAVTEVARLDGVGARTIWSWFAMVEGVRADDRLPHLAPRNRVPTRRVRVEGLDPAFVAHVRSDWLRPEAPPLTDCYRRAVKIAEAQGLAVAPKRTVRRWLDKTVSKPVQVLARQGREALKRMYPPQVRDKTALVAMEAVNADFHKFDVFVRWPALPGQNQPAFIGRPQMVAFQDIHSGMLLSWRVDRQPNSTAVMLAAGDMIETYGIPQHVLFDNGREFAAKNLTGGAETRYRFQVKEDDLPGLFTMLGCTIHWATPYAGQSKPIERAWRDLASAVSKDPRFAGAYTGNTVEAKPENYGSTAIDLDVFLAVLAEGIAEHNTRQGRRSEVAWGRSFAEVFEASYATAQPKKATEAQRRLWLLGAEGLRADRNSGQLAFMGNTYWADWMHAIAGERVIARFDPAALWDGLHIYGVDNAYLGHAPAMMKAGFFDVEEGRAHASARKTFEKAQRKMLEAYRVYTAADLGAGLDALAPPEAPRPEAKVVRAAFGKAQMPGRAAAVTPPVEDGVAQVQAGIVADLAARRGTAPVAEEAPRDRFRRALHLERQAAAGGQLTIEQRRWLGIYQDTSEYRSERALYDDFGDAIFA
jgi:putative transposase